MAIKRCASSIDVVKAAEIRIINVFNNGLPVFMSFKSLEKAAKEAPAPVVKAGKSLSTKNLETLKGISTSLSEFLSGFETDTEESNNNNTVTKKEDVDMNKEEVQKLVGEEVAKAMNPITEQLTAIAKSVGGEAGTPAGDGTPEPTEPAAPEAVTAESVAKMVGEEIAKAMEPVTKALEPLMKSRALPGNLNGESGKEVTKSEEPHFMAGMF